METYVTERFTAYQGDTLSTNLSLAVWMIDDYTKKLPIGHIRVGEIKAVKNLSGYYLFTDLVPGNYSIEIESDIYFHEERTIDTSILDPQNPVVEVSFIPKPSYPFPDHATLVRGIVSGISGPVTSAEIKVTGKTIETKTDERGEFVLYFKGIKSEAIAIEIKKGSDTKTVNTTMKEGKTISMGVISFP